MSKEKLEIGDIVTYKTSKDDKKCVLMLITGWTDNKEYCVVKHLNGAIKGVQVIRYVERLRFVAKARTKKAIHFKYNDTVTLNNKSANTDLIGKPLRFLAYLDNEIENVTDGRGELVALDCVVQDNESGNVMLGVSERLKHYSWAVKDTSKKATKEIDLSDPEGCIGKVDNKIIFVYEDDDDKVYEGEAKCNPKDNFSDETGIVLAVARAFKDKKLEEFILNREYFFNFKTIMDKVMQMTPVDIVKMRNEGNSIDK